MIEPGQASFTTKEVAVKYGISTRRVRTLAKLRGVGRRCGRDWVFTSDEVEKLKPGKPGRPGKNEAKTK